MIIPAKIVTYMSIVLSSYSSSLDNCSHYYASYTTNNIITNSNIYDINDIIEKTFLEEIQDESN